MINILLLLFMLLKIIEKAIFFFLYSVNIII